MLHQVASGCIRLHHVAACRIIMLHHVVLQHVASSCCTMLHHFANQCNISRGRRLRRARRVQPPWRTSLSIAGIWQRHEAARAVCAISGMTVCRNTYADPDALTSGV